MSLSQNLRFTGQAPPDDEFDHPVGLSIAKLLRAELTNFGWQVSEIENWRDCGWFFECSRDDARLELVVAPMRDADHWFLQIAASYRPGLIGRLFGKVATAGAAEIFALSKDVTAILGEYGKFRDFKWCWDGYPPDEGATAEPTSPE